MESRNKNTFVCAVDSSSCGTKDEFIKNILQDVLIGKIDQLQAFIDSWTNYNYELRGNKKIIMHASEKVDKAISIKYDTFNIIAYDPNHFQAQDLLEKPGYSYNKKFVIFHELGHLLMEHNECNHHNELAADEFAGRQLWRDGANRLDVTRWLKDCSECNESYTHPSKNMRIDKVIEGFTYAEENNWQRFIRPNSIDTFIKIEYPFQYIPYGEFNMGSSYHGKHKNLSAPHNETPMNKMTVDGFYIAKKEFTQELWDRFMPQSGYKNKNCPECPVEGVSYDEIQKLIKKLKSFTGRDFQLPTEVQWEYAAQYKLNYESKLNHDTAYLNKICWNKFNTKDIKEVGNKKHNSKIEIWDMLGNVYEMCENNYTRYPNNTYKDEYYDNTAKALRGGSVNYASQKSSDENYIKSLTITHRNFVHRNLKYKGVGFRLLLY